MANLSPILRKPLLYIGIVAVGGLVAAGFAVVHVRADGLASTPPPRSEVARPVLVAKIHFAPEQPTRSFVAVIKPRIEADQAFRVPGKIARRLVDVGQNVVAGEILAKLDETDLRLQKEQAESELAASRVALQQAEGDEKRGGELRAKGWTSQAVFDRQHAAAEEARSRNRRALRQVELAANALGYANLAADSDGVVTAALVEPGQVVAAGQPAIRLARKGEKEAAIALPEALVAQAREGSASLVLWAQPGRVIAARLRELSPIADAATRTFAARFALPDADARVALGMSATLTLAAPPGSAVARVPLSALFDQGRGPSLWTVAPDGALTLKPVTLVRYDGAQALISGGVADGDTIVVMGVQKLDPGQKVRTISQLSF